MSPPSKQAFTKMIAEVDAHLNWDTDNKKCVKQAIGPFVKHERNFSRAIQNAKNRQKNRVTEKRSK